MAGWELIHSCLLRPSVDVRMEIGSGFTVDAENETIMAVFSFCFKYVFSSSPLTPQTPVCPRSLRRYSRPFVFIFLKQVSHLKSLPPSVPSAEMHAY